MSRAAIEPGDVIDPQQPEDRMPMRQERQAGLHLTAQCQCNREEVRGSVLLIDDHPKRKRPERTNVQAVNTSSE